MSAARRRGAAAASPAPGAPSAPRQRPVRTSSRAAALEKARREEAEREEEEQRAQRALKGPLAPPSEPAEAAAAAEGSDAETASARSGDPPAAAAAAATSKPRDVKPKPAEANGKSKRYYCRHCSQEVAVHGHSQSLRPTFFCARCPSKEHKPRRCNQAYTSPRSAGKLVSIFTVIANVPALPHAAGGAARRAEAEPGRAIGRARPSEAAAADGPCAGLCLLIDASNVIEGKPRLGPLPHWEGGAFLASGPAAKKRRASGGFGAGAKAEFKLPKKVSKGKAGGSPRLELPPGPGGAGPGPFPGLLAGGLGMGMPGLPPGATGFLPPGLVPPGATGPMAMPPVPPQLMFQAFQAQLQMAAQHAAANGANVHGGFMGPPGSAPFPANMGPPPPGMPPMPFAMPFAPGPPPGAAGPVGLPGPNVAGRPF